MIVMKFCIDVVSQLELPVNQSCLNRFTSRLLNVCASKQLLQKLMLYMSKSLTDTNTKTHQPL